MIRAYKIVERHPKGHKTLFHGVKGTRLIKPGEWIQADEKMVTDGSCQTEYLSGWHVLLEREHAVDYIKAFKTRLDLLDIIPVWVKDIRPKAHSPHPVFLAKYMMI